MRPRSLAILVTALTTASAVVAVPAAGQQQDAAAVSADPQAMIGQTLPPAGNGTGEDFDSGAGDTGTGDTGTSGTGDTGTGDTGDTGTGTGTGDTGAGESGAASGGTTGASDVNVRTDAVRAEAIRHDVGYSNAALQKGDDKRKEARSDCVKHRPPVNRMLAVMGSAGGDAP